MKNLKMKVKNESSYWSLPIQEAKTMWPRMIGLMGDREPRRALLLRPCQAVQTCWMSFALDIYFLSKDGVIVGRYLNMPPWRQSWFYWRAHSVLEIPVPLREHLQLARGSSYLECGEALEWSYV